MGAVYQHFHGGGPTPQQVRAICCCHSVVGRESSNKCKNSETISIGIDAMKRQEPVFIGENL